MGKKIELDMEQLKDDMMMEVVIHQNDTSMGKECKRGSCHLNEAFDRAAKRQKLKKKEET